MKHLQQFARKYAVLLLLLIIPISSIAQEDDLKVSKPEALRLFENGDFETASRYFDILGSKFPRDPEYMYFRGACLVELGGDTNKAIELLEEAISSSNSVKSVPPESYYYLGRAKQLAGRFSEAINSYDSFRDRVRKKIAKEYRIDELIAMCTAGNTGKEDPVKYEMPEKVVTDISAETDISAKLDSELLVTGKEQGEKLISGETETGKIENTAEEYDRIAADALEYQFKADSLSRLTGRYRSSLKTLSGNDRESIRRKILELEEEIFRYQSLADRKLTAAAAYNRLKFEGSPQGEAQVRDTGKVVVSEEPKPEYKAVELNESGDTTATVPARIVADTIPPPEPVLIVFDENKEQAGVIPVNEKLPEGLYYRIQTAAFRNPVEHSYFRKLGPVYGIKAADSDITFYFIGMFRKQADARNALLKVRGAGFKDAFIVAVLDGERISFERADALGDKWSGVSLVEQGAGEPKKAEPLTLVFRVEAGKSDKKFSDEIIDTYRLVAGNRTFDIVQNEEAEYVCLIGKFLTFESAQQYSDLLYRNGLKDANVVAYMGEKEIPVEKAKELFRLNFDK